jgi:hypothetical protein
VVDNKNNKKKFSEIIFHGKKFSELWWSLSVNIYW